MTSARSAAAVVLAGLIIHLASPARAGVSDPAGLFSADAIKEAEGVISSIRQNFHLDLAVETTRETGLEGAALNDLAKRKAEQAQLNGVCIVVTAEPMRAAAAVGPKTQEGALREDQLAQVSDAMTQSLEKKDPDSALRAGVHRVQALLTENLGQMGQNVRPSYQGQLPAQTPGVVEQSKGMGRSWVLAFWGVAVAAVLIAVVAISVGLRRREVRVRARPPQYD